jgi:antitoxin PrlF
MIVSRITSKSQVTLPKAIRAALKLQEGDQIGWIIDEGGRVSLLPIIDEDDVVNGPDGFVNNFSAFTEWATEADSVFDNL